MGNLILASTEAASKGSSSGSTTFLLVIVVLIVGMWFLLIRPQRARQRKAMEQQRGVEPGQRVRTTAGMYGTVVDSDDDNVLVEFAPGVQIKMMRRAIMNVVPDDEPDGLHSTVVTETPDEADSSENSDKREDLSI